MQCFVILSQPSLQVQPTKGALHHPPSEQHLEGALLRRTAHQFQGPAANCLGPLHQFAARRPRQPRSPVVEGTGPTAVPAPTGRRPGPEYRRDAPPLPTAVPGCPPLCGTCAPSPSWPRRSLWAPFPGLHRLAVDDGRAGAGLPALGLSQLGMQCVMRPLPGAITTPGAEVMEHDAPRRPVMRQHPPGATGAQHVADGVDYLLTTVRDRRRPLGRWQQRFQQLPFSVAKVAGKGGSFHSPTLRPTPRLTPVCPCPNLDHVLGTLSGPKSIVSQHGNRKDFGASRRSLRQVALLAVGLAGAMTVMLWTPFRLWWPG